MYSSFFNYFIILITIIFIIIIGCVQITLSDNILNLLPPSTSENYILSDKFSWPVPRLY